MSWGERSCTDYGKCTRKNKTIYTCNTTCSDYNWDTVTTPESVLKLEKMNTVPPISEEIEEIEEITCAEDLGLELSHGKKFNKNGEMIVLKGMMFKLQSITHKKIILKVKGKAHKILSDGIYREKE